MNANDPVPSLPPVPNHQTNHSNLSWLKWIIARNPLYILSAASLLYGIYRLSIDPQVFAGEISQLFFNFGSFHLYEILLVTTGLFLARRKIFYDSALLVAFENAFVFIPFILISQAALIQGHIAAWFCLSGTLLVLARFGSLKKYLNNANLPPRLLLFGGVLLLVNVFFPLLVHSQLKLANKVVLDERGILINLEVWMFLTPLLLGIVNMLPRPKQSGEWFFQKAWFPLVAFGMWMLATCVHFYCIAYVYGLGWNVSFLAPVIWVAMWTLWNRIDDFMEEEPEFDWQNFLLLPAVAVPFLALLHRNWPVFFALTLLNVFAYGAILYRQRSSRAFHLMLVSMALMLAGMPMEILRYFDLSFSRKEAFAGALCGYVALRALLSRNPKAGIAGAMACAFGIGGLLNDYDYWLSVSMQAGFVFLLSHSLRWVDHEHVGAMSARYMTAGAWALHSAIWLYGESYPAFWIVGSFGCAMLGIYFAARWIFGIWGPRIIPYAAAAVLLIVPVINLQQFLRGAPVGLLAVIGSFILFAGGTILALKKNSWLKTERLSSSNTPNQ